MCNREGVCVCASLRARGCAVRSAPERMCVCSFVHVIVCDYDAMLEEGNG